MSDFITLEISLHDLSTCSLTILGTYPVSDHENDLLTYGKTNTLKTLFPILVQIHCIGVGLGSYLMETIDYAAGVCLGPFFDGLPCIYYLRSNHL